MHEGVQDAEEYIEGGETLESTAAIKDYYGHKGDVKLANGATLSWQRGSKEVAALRGLTPGGTMTGVESTISSESELRLAASKTGEQGRITAAQLTLQSGVTLNLDSVYLDDFSYINATNVVVQVRDTTLELSVANTLVIAEADLGTDLGLMACAEGDSLILPAGVSVRELQVDSLQGALTLTGDSLTLDMTALDLSGADAVKVSFTGDVGNPDRLCRCQ